MCRLYFAGTAEGVKVIIDNYEFKGQGELDCISATGQQAHYPANVEMVISLDNSKNKFL